MVDPNRPRATDIASISVAELADVLAAERTRIIETRIDPGTLELDLVGMDKDMDDGCATMRARLRSKALSEGLSASRVEVIARMFAWRLAAARAALEAKIFSANPKSETIH